MIAPVRHTSLRHWLVIALAVVLAAPSLVLRLLIVTGVIAELSSAQSVLIFGCAIVAAAFLLTWGSETAEKDISQGLALAAIALIAVLPEYAVDLFFAWRAPHDPDFASYATANMTGANRLLVGLGWPTVFFIFWWRSRRRTLHVGGGPSLGLVFLGVATLYSFLIPLKGDISLIDSAVLVSLFVAYMYLVSRAPVEEPELVGPAATLGALEKVPRRITVALLFIYSAAAIFASAEPFAEGLVKIGENLDIDEFVLVQWLAPLASEAPEFIVAALVAWRGRALAAMGILIAAKVNQWTLLIGSLPVAYSLSGTTLSPLPMDSRQVEEMFLTATQSAFAVAIFASLSISFLEAGLLSGLFSSQLLSPLAFGEDVGITVRYGFGVVYLLLAAWRFYGDRTTLPTVFREAKSLARGVAPSTGLSPPET